MNDRLPLSLKRKGYNQCVLPVLIYWGRNIWGLTMHLERKHRSAQEAMERRMTAECLETGNDLGSDHYIVQSTLEPGTENWRNQVQRIRHDQQRNRTRLERLGLGRKHWLEDTL